MMIIYGDTVRDYLSGDDIYSGLPLPFYCEALACGFAERRKVGKMGRNTMGHDIIEFLLLTKIRLF